MADSGVARLLGASAGTSFSGISRRMGARPARGRAGPRRGTFTEATATGDEMEGIVDLDYYGHGTFTGRRSIQAPRARPVRG